MAVGRTDRCPCTKDDNNSTLTNFVYKLCG